MPEILHVGPSLAPVAILIPAYNAATYLAQAIESVLRQTHRDFDLLILDDASTDNTQEVARRYLADPRVSYLRNERNLGMSANWNKGLSILRNEFIAKLDADDYYEPGFLAEVLPVFENDLEVGLVFTGVNWISSEERDVLFYTNKWVCEGRSFLQNLLRLCVLFSPTICVRRQCYSRLGGFLDKMPSTRIGKCGFASVAIPKSGMSIRSWPPIENIRPTARRPLKQIHEPRMTSRSG